MLTSQVGRDIRPSPAYAHVHLSETIRAEAFTAWLHHYNYHRRHTSLGGKAPADRVINICGQYI